MLNVFATLSPASNQLSYVQNEMPNIAIDDTVFLNNDQVTETQDQLWAEQDVQSVPMHGNEHIFNLDQLDVRYMERSGLVANLWSSAFLCTNWILGQVPQDQGCCRCTKCSIQKQSLVQRATFSSYTEWPKLCQCVVKQHSSIHSSSSYKNHNMIKVLVGSSPGGMVSFCSQAFGGSVSVKTKWVYIWSANMNRFSWNLVYL